MTLIRAATHSGSWYSSDPQKLSQDIEEYLVNGGPKISGARVVVGPHAGYFYAGDTLGKAYGALDTQGIKRVFILGPSHHVYFKGYAMTTACSMYETPFGDIPIDTDVTKELTSGKLFKKMSLDVDEEEHSFEMHMPFLFKSCQGTLPKVIPIMISGSNEQFEMAIANQLEPYFKDKSNAFIISTDFCHWGGRFGYTAYTPTGDIDDLMESPSKVNIPIYKSIEAMDKKGMELLSSGSYSDFRGYINDTGNTICGAKPLSILLALMESQNLSQGTDNGFMKWVGYTQSSPVKSIRDSSVSYAAGYAVI